MNSDSPKPDRKPPDDPVALRRPVKEAAHQRFFEDGEEPPERYDRDDELAYILPRSYTVKSREWIRIARRHYGECRGEFAKFSFFYMLLAFAGGNCAGIIYMFALDPPLRAGFSIYALGKLSGKRQRYGEFFSGFKHFGKLIVCALPDNALKFATIMTLEFGILFTVLSREYWFGGGMTLLAFLILASVALFLGVRLTGFAVELVLDRGFDALQAFRGSWYLTRGHFWGLFWLLLRLWTLEFIVMLFTCGIGLIWLEPLIALIWTTAYLDIAGSEQLIDPDLDEKVGLDPAEH